MTDISTVINQGYSIAPELIQLGIISFALGLSISGIKFLIWSIFELKFKLK